VTVGSADEQREVVGVGGENSRIIILHHGADDYNHMAMQGASQLGTHEEGY